MDKSIVAGLFSFMIGVLLATAIIACTIPPRASVVVGAKVLKTSCTNTHCSVLVEKDDQPREWLYIEKAVPKVGR